MTASSTCWPSCHRATSGTSGTTEGTTAAPRFVATRDTIRDTDGKAIFSDRQNIPQIVDIDCDGKVDLLIGRITGVILQYISPHPGSLPPVFKLITERFQDLEIVTGQGSMHGANTMVFVRPR